MNRIIIADKMLWKQYFVVPEAFYNFFLYLVFPISTFRKYGYKVFSVVSVWLDIVFNSLLTVRDYSGGAPLLFMYMVLFMFLFMFMFLPAVARGRG